MVNIIGLYKRLSALSCYQDLYSGAGLPPKICVVNGYLLSELLSYTAGHKPYRKDAYTTPHPHRKPLLSTTGPKLHFSLVASVEPAITAKSLGRTTWKLHTRDKRTMDPEKQYLGSQAGNDVPGQCLPLHVNGIPAWG